MSTYRRGSKFHYRFRIDGRDYSGPCPESDVPRIPRGASDREVKAIHRKADAYEAMLRAEVDRVMPVVESGGYIPQLDHSAPPDISWTNMCQYMEYLLQRLGRG